MLQSIACLCVLHCTCAVIIFLFRIVCCVCDAAWILLLCGLTMLLVLLFIISIYMLRRLVYGSSHNVRMMKQQPVPPSQQQLQQQKVFASPSQQQSLLAHAEDNQQQLGVNGAGGGRFASASMHTVETVVEGGSAATATLSRRTMANSGQMAAPSERHNFPANRTLSTSNLSSQYRTMSAFSGSQQRLLLPRRGFGSSASATLPGRSRAIQRSVSQREVGAGGRDDTGDETFRLYDFSAGLDNAAATTAHEESAGVATLRAKMSAGEEALQVRANKTVAANATLRRSFKATGATPRRSHRLPSNAATHAHGTSTLPPKQMFPSSHFIRHDSNAQLNLADVDAPRDVVVRGSPPLAPIEASGFSNMNSVITSDPNSEHQTSPPRTINGTMSLQNFGNNSLRQQQQTYEYPELGDSLPMANQQQQNQMDEVVVAIPMDDVVGQESQTLRTATLKRKRGPSGSIAPGAPPGSSASGIGVADALAPSSSSGNRFVSGSTLTMTSGGSGSTRTHPSTHNQLGATQRSDRTDNSGSSARVSVHPADAPSYSIVHKPRYSSSHSRERDADDPNATAQSYGTQNRRTSRTATASPSSSKAAANFAAAAGVAAPVNDSAQWSDETLLSPQQRSISLLVLNEEANQQPPQQTAPGGVTTTTTPNQAVEEPPLHQSGLKVRHEPEPKVQQQQSTRQSAAQPTAPKKEAAEIHVQIYQQADAATRNGDQSIHKPNGSQPQPQPQLQPQPQPRPQSQSPPEMQAQQQPAYQQMPGPANPNPSRAVYTGVDVGVPQKPARAVKDKSLVSLSCYTNLLHHLYTSFRILKDNQFIMIKILFFLDVHLIE